MKPSLAITTNIYILLAKVINYIATIAASYPLTTLVSSSKSRPVKVLLALATAAWPLAAQEHGTSISIIRTPSEIAVAVDSFSRDESGKVTSKAECKIRKFGEFYAVATGVSENFRTGFNVWAILDEASKRNGSVFDKISQFEKLAKPLMWESVKRAEPSKRTLEVIFVGFLNGVPWLIGRKLILDESVGKEPAVRFQPDSCPGNLCLERTIAGYFVPNSSLKRFEQENPNFLREDLAIAARKFVQLNIDIKHPGVGGDIAILRITKDGATWIDKGACPDIQPQDPPAKPRQEFPSPDKKAPPNKRGAPIEMIMAALVLSAALIYLFIKRR